MKTVNFAKTISTYWWNCGKKTNDFNGTVGEYLYIKRIKVSAIKHPIQKDIKGFRFKLTVSNATVTIDSFSWADDAAFDAVKIFITLLGDKAQIKTGYKTIDIN